MKFRNNRNISTPKTKMLFAIKITDTKHSSAKKNLTMLLRPIVLSLFFLPAHGTATAEVIGVFPGAAGVMPMTLFDEPCVPSNSKMGWRALWHFRNPYQKANHEACWDYADETRQTLEICAKVDGEWEKPVTNNCYYVGSKYFIDPNSLPRSAF